MISKDEIATELATALGVDEDENRTLRRRMSGGVVRQFRIENEQRNAKLV